MFSDKPYKSLNALFFCLIVLFLIAQKIDASDLGINLYSGIYRGYTTYQIGGFAENDNGQSIFHFPVSQLKFPLNIYVVKADLRIPLGDSFCFEFAGLKNLSRGAGKMEDSDWLKATYDQPDVYSVNTAILNFYQYNPKLKYRLGYFGKADNRQEFWIGLGYLYKSYDFTLTDSEQSYPKDPDLGTKHASGTVMTYGETYRIPYIDFGINQTFGNFSCGLNIGLAPYVTVDDRDDHVLRSKLALGSDSGNALLASGVVKYSFTQNWAGIFQADYMYVYATGKQTQTRYADTTEGKAGLISELDQKIKNENYSFNLGLQYQFCDTIKQPSVLPAISTNNQKDMAAFKPYLGLAYQSPFAELDGAFGPTVEIADKNLAFGLGYFQGQNRVQTLSLGTYTMIPIYGLWKIPINSAISLMLGGGYSFNTNKLDPQIVSHLAYLGYNDAQEIIKSSPFLLAGIEIDAPNSNGLVKYVLQYKYDKSNVEAKDSQRKSTTSLDLSAVLFSIKIGL